MKNNKNQDQQVTLDEALKSISQLEPLLKKILPLAKEKKIKSGGDLTNFIAENKIRIPAIFSGDRIYYEQYKPEFEKSKNKLIILTKPNGNISNVLGIRIGCVTIRGRRVCLECGWLHCKIVIYF
jgi:hypothetical protein